MAKLRLRVVSVGATRGDPETDATKVGAMTYDSSSELGPD